MRCFNLKFIIFLGSIFNLPIVPAMAQAILGPSQVTAGQTHQYTIDWNDFSNTPTQCGENNLSFHFWWLDDPSGQTYYPTNPSSNIVVTFGLVNTSVTLHVDFYCLEANLYYTKSKMLTVTGAPPGLPITPSAPIVTQNCFGHATLERPEPISGDVIYYWQTTENGTNVGNSNKIYPLEVSQVIYLRAKNSTGWSNASSSISVNIVGQEIQENANITLCDNAATESISLPNFLNIPGSQWRIVRDELVFGLNSMQANNFVAVDYILDYGYEYAEGRAIDLEYTLVENNCTRKGYKSIFVKNAGLRPSIQPQGPTTFCQNGSVVLQAQSGESSYQWLKNGLVVQSGMNNLTTYVANESGTYSFKHSKNGCISESSPVEVTVLPLIPITISPSNNALIEFKKLSVLLTASSSGNYTYRWYRNNQAIEGATSATYAAEKAGSYSVQLDDGHGCTNISPVTNVFLENNYNYVITQNLKAELKDGLPITKDKLPELTEYEKQETINYFDGIGRPMQSISTQESPLKNDIIVPSVYDSYGRESIKYLPVTVDESNGHYKRNTDILDGTTLNYKGIAANVYTDDRPFAETQFEASPLNRPLKTYGVGSAWKANNKASEHQYLTNIHGEGLPLVTEKIIAWKIVDGALIRAAARTGFVEAGGYYSTGQLFIKSTKDEQGNEVREYTNKDGEVLLKKVQAVAAPTNLNSNIEWASTYYIYDDFGDLVVVLPPEAVKALAVSQQ